MSYPLNIRFKILAIARQLSVTGSDGRLLMYAKMKAFKLKEAITVYSDEAQSRPIYRIAADRIIDFNATYTITGQDNAYVGAIRQAGMRSLWRTHYEIVRHDDVIFTVREENPWAKVADGLLGEIPVLGLLAGYLFHPRYLITTADGTAVVRIEKQPALMESLFVVNRLDAQVPAVDEALLLIGAVTMVLLERQRG